METLEYTGIGLMFCFLILFAGRLYEQKNERILKWIKPLYVITSAIVLYILIMYSGLVEAFG